MYINICNFEEIAPQETAEYRIASSAIDGNGAHDERIELMQRLWEVNGWDLIEVCRKGCLNHARMFFRKPRNAPDITPFVDPNAKQAGN